MRLITRKDSNIIWSVIKLDKEEAMMLIAGIANALAHKKEGSCLSTRDQSGECFKFELESECKSQSGKE